MNKWTPGPWVLIEGANIYSALGADSGDGIPADKTDGWHIATLGDAPTFVDGIELELGHNVKQSNGLLMTAAPDLLEALEKMLDNEGQRAFENWLRRTAPSGCCESVDAQWKMSSDYSEFLDDWAVQISAIAKARGEA